jgi:hypothetical protein
MQARGAIGVAPWDTEFLPKSGQLLLLYRS